MGGWVKSKREKKEKSHVGPLKVAGETGQDVSFGEVLLSKVPFLRSIARVLVRRDGALVGKEEPSMASVAYLRINDGSGVANLQV